MSDRRVVRWVTEGPDASDGTLGWMLGNFLWWRLQASIFFAVLPLTVGLIVYAHEGGFWGVLATTVVHTAIQKTQMKVNPKYNVTKNY